MVYYTSKDTLENSITRSAYDSFLNCAKICMTNALQRRTSEDGDTKTHVNIARKSFVIQRL